MNELADDVRRLRDRVQNLEAETYQLRARLARCTCGAAKEIAAEVSPKDEQQIDLLQQLGCLDCDA